MERSRSTRLLCTGLTLIASCVSTKNAFDETRLYHDPETNRSSIWAVDYDGIARITLRRTEQIWVDNLDDTYIEDPTGKLTRLPFGLTNGTYSIGVYDTEGNYFEKQFTKTDVAITHP